MILPSKFDVFNGKKILVLRNCSMLRICFWRNQSVALPTVLRPYFFQKLLLAKTFGSAPDCFKVIHNFKIAFGENVR